MKKLLSLVLVLSMLLGLVAMVSADEAPKYDLQGKTVKVRLWDKPNPYAEDVKETDKAEWLPRYEAMMKKYNVKFEFYTSPSEYDDMPAEWIQSVTSGAPAWHITNNFSVMWLPKLALSNALTDISAPLAKLVMPESFKDVGTFKDGKFGYITEYPGPECLVFNRKMIMDAGMEKDPMQMFQEGKWDYENFVKYMTELQSKLSEGNYAFFIDPMYWGLFAPPANGKALAVRPDYSIGLMDVNFIEAMETLEKLTAAGTVRPANKNEKGESDYWGTPAATFDKGVEVAMTHRAVWQYGALNENKLDWGIVPYPYGNSAKPVMGEDGKLKDIENYHSMYYDTGLTGVMLAGVENDFPGLEKDYVIEALTNLTFELFFTEEKIEELKKMVSPDFKVEVNANDFASEEDAAVFAWLKEKIIFNPIATMQNAGLGKSYNGEVSLYTLLRKPFVDGTPVRATFEAAVPEIEASFRDAGLLK